jgi:hyperosmotically inducible protein
MRAEARSAVPPRRARVPSRVAVGLCLLTLLVGAGGSFGAPQERELRERRVLEGVVEAVERYPRYTVFDFISARYDRGTVTLMGKVTMPFKRTEIERRVRRVPGVDEVVNEITVLPVSRNDEELRHGIARAIYGNPSFWQYAAMANPPIHVVVEGGRVTLYGIVQSEVEKHLARALAGSSHAFSVTSELMTEAEWRASRPR